MPWEKTFNEEKAIQSAMTLFWEKGYTDTSMADLLKVTGLTKGSFYNAFGSKHEIFEKALLKYDRETRKALIQELCAMDDPIKAIETFMAQIVEDSINDPDKKGCFVINSSLHLNALDKDIQKIIRNAFSELEVFFKQMIELGQLRKIISDTIDPVESAKIFVATVVSIRVLGRGIFAKRELEHLSKQSLKILN